MDINQENIDYDSIPVYYCKNCLSLRILDIDAMEECDYGDECGSTEIAKSTIDEQESLYKEKYKHKYVETK